MPYEARFCVIQFFGEKPFPEGGIPVFFTQSLNPESVSTHVWTLAVGGPFSTVRASTIRKFSWSHIPTMAVVSYASDISRNDVGSSYVVI